MISKIIASIGLVGLFSFTSGVNFFANEPDQQIIVRLEQMIPELMQEGGVPGISIALIRNSKIIWSRGFGVKSASGAPANNPVQ